MRIKHCWYYFPFVLSSSRIGRKGIVGAAACAIHTLCTVAARAACVGLAAVIDITRMYV